MKKSALLLILLSALLIFSGCAQKWDSPPPMSIDQSKEYSAVIETNYGNIEVELFDDETPVTVNNFVFLSREGFYNGTKFHRVKKGFVIQGGDPTGTGSGGPGYQFADEPVTRDYVAGTLAMANSGRNTNGSQFFICLADLTTLPKNYTIFGIVTNGFDVVQRIGNVPVSLANNEWSLPDADIKIKSVTISEN